MGIGGRIAIAAGLFVSAIVLILAGMAVVVVLLGVGGFVAGSTPALEQSGATLSSGTGPAASMTPTPAGTAGHPKPAAVAGAAPTASLQPPASELVREIRVFFSRHPQSDSDFAAVFPVVRTAGDAGVARAALLHLIGGPTPQEAAAGYFSELGRMLDGPSSCGADPFSIRLEQGLATVRFCTPIRSAGIGQDARVRSGIEATLLQFSTIQRVRLLTEEGHCLFDMSGEDRCLRDP